MVFLLFVFFWSHAQGNAASSTGKTGEKPMLSPQSKIIQDKALKDLWPATKSPVSSPSSGPLMPNAIGCALPLTGRFADAGNRALDAMLLSADLFNVRQPSPWKILVTDSGGTASGIRDSIAYLADVARVIAIVAMTGTAEAADAAREAQKRRVPLILITSREGVTHAGEYVFQHFLTPSQQTDAITRYAHHHFHAAIFSILYPQDDYGEEMARLFHQSVQKMGGLVVKAIAYHKNQVDFTKQIQELTGISPADSIQSPANNRPDWSGSSPLDFEALFIPDSPRRVKSIAEHLAFYGIKDVQLLGTSLWNSSELWKGNVKHLEGSVFTDSFLVNGFLPETNDFVDAYYLAYGREPDNIDALSYDTMKMSLNILKDGQIRSRAAFLKAFSAIQYFRGVTGQTSFSGGRVSQKDAFILKVQNGQIEQIR